MKNLLKLLGVVMLGMVLFTSCSKDDDPANNDFFVGTYTGEISYRSSDKTIRDEDGKVTVSKVGDTYRFMFGSGIPDITGVKFEKRGDNTYASIGSGLTGITIDANSLDMLVVRDGQTWTADCSR